MSILASRDAVETCWILLSIFADSNGVAGLDSIPVPAKAEPTGKRIAIIGGGPSGLTTAYFLQLMGHQTVVFEEKPALGGMLRYGIPNYRFPRKRLAQDIDYILKTGVEVRLNTQIGRDISMEDLEKAGAALCQN